MVESILPQHAANRGIDAAKSLQIANHDLHAVLGNRPHADTARHRKRHRHMLHQRRHRPLLLHIERQLPRQLAIDRRHCGAGVQHEVVRAAAVHRHRNHHSESAHEVKRHHRGPGHVRKRRWHRTKQSHKDKHTTSRAKAAEIRAGPTVFATGIKTSVRVALHGTLLSDLGFTLSRRK